MKVPYANFKTRINDTKALGGCTFIGGEWKDVDTKDIFEGKKVVVFALPGAFTPTCSSRHLPDYESKYDEVKALGVDEVYCLSVNDSYVMNAWARDEKIEKVKMIPDGNAVVTQGMGMLVNEDKNGFGMRSWRYSMLVDDGEIVKMFEEPGKPDGSAFEVSDVDTMIKYLKENAG